jgi:RND family efflux transporter MFP subunit
MVTVDSPIEKTLRQYVYATGRTDPIEQVDIRARVSGYLKSIKFQPGREVQKGQLLFEIDPDQYEADLARAKASQKTAEEELANSEAALARTQARENTTKLTAGREEELFKRGAGSEQERDRTRGIHDEAVADVKASNATIKLSEAKIEEAKATVKNADLNLHYCSIHSPINGVAGDWLVTDGNLIAGGQGITTLLTTVVAVEKMDVAFDVDENTLEQIQLAVREGKIKQAIAGEIPAEAGLAIHGTGYPLGGKINFQDNKVDTKTGTIRLKARFDNPKPSNGSRLLAAGMYTRVRVPVGEPVKSMLVPESAFGSDQGIKYLFLLDPENKAVRMDAVLGILDGEMRAVESVSIPGEGKPRPLTLNDRIIVSGIQRVRPGMTVDPKKAKK